MCSAGGVGLEELWTSAHLNCAAVAIKLGEWSGACAACSVVLQQSPSHPKVRSVYTLMIWLHKSIQFNNVSVQHLSGKQNTFRTVAEWISCGAGTLSDGTSKV